jgi:hypothetical protein
VKHTFKAVKPLVAKQWIKQLNLNIEKYKAMSPEQRGSVMQGETGHGGGDHAEPHNILQKPEGHGCDTISSRRDTPFHSGRN